MSIPCTLGDGLALEGLHPLVRAVVEAAKAVGHRARWITMPADPMKRTTWKCFDCGRVSETPDKLCYSYNDLVGLIDAARALVAAMEEKHE